MSAKIAQEVEDRIVASVRKHPEYGAPHITADLKQDGITVSSSTVYRVLKRHGLRTRAKVPDLKIYVKQPPKSTKKTAQLEPTTKSRPPKILPETSDRIVEISLQNADYGARKLLPILAGQGIQVSESFIYTILKRRNLQTRAKRLAQLDLQRISEEANLLPAALPPIVTEEEQLAEPDEEEKPPPDIILESPPQVNAEKYLLQKLPTVATIREKPVGRISWILHAGNILLLSLLVYFGYNSAQTIRQNWQKPDIEITFTPPPISQSLKSEEVSIPLNAYQAIWDRNLFNVADDKPAAAPIKEVAPETVPPADQDFGLKLLGTVVADNPEKSVAVVLTKKSRLEEPYHEGDKVDKVLVKQILRNKVIIATAEGDRLLIVEIEETGLREKSSSSKRSAIARNDLQPQTLEKIETQAKGRSIQIDQEEVEASLADLDKVLQEIDISPYKLGDLPRGFRIGKISAQNILRKMGLRSRDVIVGVNEVDIKNPEQAGEFFNTLADGGNVVIRVRRRARTRKIYLSID